MDRETDKIYKEGEKWEEFVKSAGWEDAKKKLYDKLITFDSISGVPKESKSFEEIGREASMREAVVAMIIQWIQEIEGEAAQHSGNKATMEAIRKESIVTYFE